MNRRTKAFTLIEMLLVISIIAILCVLLLAALRSARSTARMAQCMANVKNLGAGLHAFAVRNKSYGMPGAPNAYCNNDGTDVSKANQQSGVAPNTLWTSNVQKGNLQPYNPFLPVIGYPVSGQVGSRFVNHGILYKGGEVNDERSFACPDMDGMYTPDPTDMNGFAKTLQPYLADPDPAPPKALAPSPASNLAWMSSYDYRSCYDPAVPLYNGTNVNQDHSGQGDRAADYKGPYGYINLGKMGAESPVFADTIQNPAGLKMAHENRRYNVVYADGHGAIFQDDQRAAQFASSGSVTYAQTDTVDGRPVSSIASMGLSIAKPNYWYWNERIWNELFARP